MLIGEGFAEDDVVGSKQFGENDLRGAAREEIGIAVGARSGQLHGSEGYRHAVVGDFVGAETVDGSYAWQCGNFFRKVRGKGWMAICGWAARGTNIEIGGELGVPPSGNGAAKTSHHESA